MQGGDTVYHISSKTIHAEVVTEVRCEITNGKIDLLNSRIFTLDIYDKDDNFYRFSKLGVSLFLTQAEAEAELAKIRGNNGVHNNISHRKCSMGFKLLSLGEGIIIIMLLDVFAYMVKKRGKK